MQLQAHVNFWWDASSALSAAHDSGEQEERTWDRKTKQGIYFASQQRMKMRKLCHETQTGWTYDKKFIQLIEALTAECTSFQISEPIIPKQN